MDLQTQIPFVKESKNLIDYNSKVLLLGSCFAENIGEKLEHFKFQNTVNPFGIMFHPKAIETLISNAINNKKYVEKDLFFNNERWHCFDAHSKLSNPLKDELLKDLNASVKATNQQINKSTHLIITLGTAWVYRFIESKQIVTNCHKVQQKKFKKEILSIDEIVNSLENIENHVQSINPDIQIIYTVSPVRHIKDGFVQNQRSKAHLITAIHNVLTPRKQSKGLQYFPSYEIMMDELRDYRFYDDDMIHPNKTVINYIWEKFQQVWISSEASITMNEVNTIQNGLQHKSFNPNSNSHQQFLQNLEDRKKQLHLQFPHIIF